MPKTNPDIKSKVGNVNHPFSKRENETALKMWGSHPARQAVVNGGGDDYNAAQEYENLRTKVDPYGVSTSYHSNLTQPSAPTVPLPTSEVQSFTSGNYENPTGTTNPDTNNNSNSLSYSFMEDLESGPLSKKQDEHKNKFGFWKRNLPSLDARYKKALNDGKINKAKRLKKKIDNFKQNQKDRSADDATFGDKINPKNWL